MIRIGKYAKRTKLSFDCSKQSKGFCAFLAIILTLCGTLLMWWIAPPRFAETNDDMIMASFGYGYMTGAYSEFLVYINVLVGLAMKACLTVFPNVPWYTVFQVGLILASTAVFVYLVLWKFGWKEALLPLALLYCSFGYEVLSSLQFTKTAGIAVIAGLLLLFYALEHRGKWYTYLFGIFLTFAGSLYRFGVFEMLLLFAFPVGFAMVWKQLRQRQWLKILGTFAPFVLVIALCFGASIYDDYVYDTTPGWEDFWDYNQLRSSLTDRGYPPYEWYEDIYTQLGISANDFHVYTNGNYGDTELYTREVIEQLVAAKPEEKVDFSLFAGTIGRGFMEYAAFWCVLCLGFLCLLYVKNRGGLLYLVYEALALIGIQVFFFARGRYLQSRVDIMILLAICLVFILYVLPPAYTKHAKRLQYSMLASLLLISIAVPIQAEDLAVSDARLAVKKQTQIEELITTDPDHFYLYYNSWSGFPDIMWDVWGVGEPGCGRNRAALGTWRASTPFIPEKYSKYGITNPYRDAIDRSDIYVMFSNNSVDYLLQYFRENYTPDAQMSLVKKADDKFTVYRVHTKPVSLDTAAAAPIDDRIHSSIQALQDPKNGVVLLSGELYREGSNSFADSIYVQLEDPIYGESWHYATQIGDTHSDILSGGFGAFNCALVDPSEGSKITVYLESGEELYQTSFIWVAGGLR